MTARWAVRPRHRSARRRANHVIPTRKSPTRKRRTFSTLFACRRVILLCSYIRLAPSDIALRAVLGANRISLRAKARNITFRTAKNITSRVSEIFHLSCDFTLEYWLFDCGQKRWCTFCVSLLCKELQKSTGWVDLNPETHKKVYESVSFDAPTT